LAGLPFDSFTPHQPFRSALLISTLVVRKLSERGSAVKNRNAILAREMNSPVYVQTVEDRQHRRRAAEPGKNCAAHAGNVQACRSVH